MTEIFIPIAELPSYKIGKLGTVVNKRGHKICVQIDKYGYAKVVLRTSGKYHHRFVHRLLALAFMPNPENKPLINHKNSIRTDNRLENLEWCTNRENIIHGFKNGRIGTTARGEKVPGHILKEVDIPAIRLLLKNPSYTLDKIGKLYGVSGSTIFSIKSGKNWRHII